MMVDPDHMLSARSDAPTSLDPTHLARRDSEVSPSISSLQSSRVHTPSTSVPSTPIVPTRSPSPEKRPLHPGDSNTFLTALAAQERRVLELKEELQKAEVDLKNLKKQWAIHEATNKRHEAKRSEQLQPLKTNPSEFATIREEGSIQTSRELDRRKTLSSSTRSSQRKVFSGSRHTRTLSLLSTKNPTSEQHFPPRGDSLGSRAKSNFEPVSELSASQKSLESMKEPFRSPDRDMIIETGKQLVGDFRQGFWTFVEDLKQVTVGEETSPLQETRGSPKGNLQGPRKTFEKTKSAMAKESRKKSEDEAGAGDGHKHDDAENFKGQDERCVEDENARLLKASEHSQQTKVPTCNSDNEGWDNWETPSAISSISVDQSRTSGATASPLTEQSSPRSSVSSSDPTLRPKGMGPPSQIHDAIPWPSLSQLSPTGLSSTASTLMSGWGKSLSRSANELSSSSISPFPKDAQTK